MSWLPSPEHADWWYLWSQRGLTWFGVATAIALLLQLWASGERDRQAELRTASLETRTAEARSESDKANAEVARAKERIAELQRDGEKLRAQAESDRLARIKIEQKLADRSLDERQYVLLIAAASNFATQEYEFTTYWDAREPMAISNRISHALSAAGWTYIKPTGFSALLGGVEGVEVNVGANAPSKTSEAAKAVVQALNELGIAARIKTGTTSIQSNRIGFVVGTKPQ